ncbi:MAG: cell division protein FtsL [Vicinamibacterales bacterium]
MEHAETFDYAIRKDVRNTTIVREVDERRQRQLWTSIAIGVVLVAVVMFDAWQHFELIRQGYEIEALQKARAVEEDTARHLRLEIETLRAPQRIERLAETQLGMRRPKAADTIVLERVLPAEPPARSVVASR